MNLKSIVYIRSVSGLNTLEIDVTSKKVAINKCKIDTMQREDPIEAAIVASKMATPSEIDLSSNNKPNVASELNTIPKIEVTSEIDVTSRNDDVASETMVTSGKNSVDDAPKIDAASEIYVASNADMASNKIDEVSIDQSSNIGVPSKTLRRKSYADRQEKRHSIVELDRSVSKHEFERNFAEVDATVSSAGILASDGNFYGNIRREESTRDSSSVADEKSKIRQTFAVEEPPKAKRTEGLFAKATSEITEEGSSAVESEKSKLEEASATMGVSKMRVPEGPSTESLSGIKKRKAKGSLRNSLRRKVDLIERILEDQVERIWEENVEKHTWLQPIETWITDHRRPSSNYTLMHCEPDDASDNLTEINEDVMPEPTYDFKFTPAKGEDEEPKIESRLMENRRTARVDEPKIESKVTEHWRRLRNRTASSKSDRVEPTSSNTQVNKQETDLLHGEENPSVLEVKEIKRNDILEKLKEKMEDIHRVELQKNFNL